MLGEVSGYDLYYSLTHPLKWKPFGLETCTGSYYLVLNFYQINGDGEIWTRDHLVIKALIPCQRTISTQLVKLLGEVPRYDWWRRKQSWKKCVFLWVAWWIWLVLTSRMWWGKMKKKTVLWKCYGKNMTGSRFIKNIKGFMP